MTHTPTPEVPQENLPEEVEDAVPKPHEVVPEAIEEASHVRLVALTERKKIMDEMDPNVVKKRMKLAREVQRGQAA